MTCQTTMWTEVCFTNLIVIWSVRYYFCKRLLLIGRDPYLKCSFIKEQVGVYSIMLQRTLRSVLNGTWSLCNLSLAEDFYSPKDPNLKKIMLPVLTLRLLMSYIYIHIYIYIYEVPILDVSRSHTTTHHSR